LAQTEALEMDACLYRVSLTNPDPAYVAGIASELEGEVHDALSREEAPALTRARHRRLVEEAGAALVRALPNLADAPELSAEDVRLAAFAIGCLTGRINVEDLLDEIFSSFCIGK
jgi:tRNA modification GTPase